MQTSIPLKTGDNLSSKVSSSAFWIFLFQILDNVLGFLRLLILARILTPNDFGLVAIAWLIMQIFNAFTQTGMHQVLVQKQKIETYLNTAWTYLLIRGILLFVILSVTAPFLGMFFNSPDSVAIIRVIAITLLFDGLTNIGIIYFQKDFQFNKQFIQQISGNLVDFVVAITLALIFRDVWALVYGSVANSFVKLVLSYALSNYRPRIEFKWDLFKELNNYGKWIAGSNFLQFVYSQGDDLLVGRMLGTTSLGYYQLAYRISNLPATQITHIISSVMFPAYAAIQSDKVRLSKIYLQVFQLITFLSFFVGTMIIAFAYDFTLLFLGEKWLPMVPAMQILTVWGVLRSIGATTGPVWKALGTPAILTKIQTLQVIILVIIIYPLSLVWDIAGTSLAVVISALIPNIIAIYVMLKTLQIKLKSLNKEIVIPLLGGITISLIYYLFTQVIIQINNIFSFILSTFICSVTYFIYSIIAHKFFKYSLYNNIIKLIRTLFKNSKATKFLIKAESFLKKL